VKTRNKVALLLALGLGLIGTALQVQTDPPDADPGRPGVDQPQRPPPLGRVLERILQKYDTNQDGQLDKDEMAALQKDIREGKLQPSPGRFGPGRAGFGGPGRPGGPPPLPKEIMEKYDLNHDGQLEPEERQALHRDIQDGKIQLPGPGPAREGMGGPPARPRLDAQHVLQRFDTDKDGKLDAAELKAFLDDLKQHLPPPRPPGPGGPPLEGPGQ
jgi:EF hand